MIAAIHGFGKTVALIHQDPDHIPRGQADQDRVYVFFKPVAILFTAYDAGVSLKSPATIKG